jgi:predicted SAM-dependent methyltransferase
MRINLGCGENRLEGWNNHDADVDITKRLPWDDNEIDFILAEHVVEQVTHIEALGFMQECWRVLRPGGTLRLCIPVLDALNREHAIDIILNHGHKAAYSPELICSMLFAAGFEHHRMQASDRAECDGHWKIIGAEKDDLETARIEVTK